MVIVNNYHFSAAIQSEAVLNHRCQEFRVQLGRVDGRRAGLCAKVELGVSAQGIMVGLALAVGTRFILLKGVLISLLDQ